ncbi:MAG: SxtJ family membrane protein [Pseudomonadota bacterium]
MAGNKHEGFEDYHEVKTSSDRAFGLTIGAILLLIAGVRLWLFDAGQTSTIAVAAPGALLFLFGFIAPGLLAPLNKIWTKFGLLLAMIINPIIMAIMYFVLFVPIGLFMKIRGRDALRQKPDREAETFWIKRDPAGPEPETMTNQF